MNIANADSKVYFFELSTLTLFGKKIKLLCISEKYVYLFIYCKYIELLNVNLSKGEFAVLPHCLNTATSLF